MAGGAATWVGLGLAVLLGAGGCGEDSRRVAELPGAETDTADPEADVVEPRDAGADGEIGDAPPDTEGDSDGDADAAIAAPLVTINEFDCRADWVELVHLGGAGGEAVALDGWTLGDGGVGAAHRMALSGTLAAGGRAVFDLTGFGLACGDEGPVLRRGALAVETAPPGNAPEGFTFGRFPDATGAFVVTAATRGAVNRLPDGDPFDPAAALFGALRPVATVELSLPETSVASLWAEPYLWVPGTFAWFDAGKTAPRVPPQPVAVRSKGQYGSFRDLDGKTAFKLDFERFWPGAEFVGLAGMTLNNMVQDGDHVNEVLAYDLFRRLGVPTPRSRYVWVRVNGQDFGLYLFVEPLDAGWRARHFSATLGFFEGQYGDDLFPGAAFRLDLDGGDEAARLALDLVAERIASAPEDGFMAALAPYVAWDEVIAMLATEVFVGHWDGYGPSRNNYFVHLDAAGVLRLVPWGVDQTFGEDWGFYGGEGLLLRGCVGDPACRLRWEQALGALAAVVTAPGYLGWADGLAEELQPFMDAEPREDAGEAQGGLERAWDFLARRAEQVETLLTCLQDPGADIDEDGRTCAEDCAEGDPLSYVGAPEVCGDGIDQDCNGRPDDGEDCPDCVPADVLGAAYLFCWRERTWAEAEALCVSEGGHLPVFGSDEELAAVMAEAAAHGLWTSWIGLSDEAEEGTFRWVTGEVWVPGSGGGFMDNQPDDWQGAEDCVESYADAGERPWNDLACDAQIPAVCELLPPP